MTKLIFNHHEVSKEKPCKRCGGTERQPITRKNPNTGESYKTTRCRTCARNYQRKSEDEYGHMSRWQKKNREHLRAYQREYYKGKYAARNAKHDKRIKERFVYDDMDEIQEFYRNCPTGFHVDHIVPLNGKNVSGLHTVSNLQYLPATENLRKSNKF